MRIKVSFFLMFAMAAAAVFIAVNSRRSQPSSRDAQQPVLQLSADAPETDRPSSIDPDVPPVRPFVPAPGFPSLVPAEKEKQPVATNKLERLNQIRETFRAFAAGDPAAALKAAKQITDEIERETALLTLVTEWTHGELGPAKRRAHAIDAYGLEAGLAFEIANKPELAIPWANELSDGPGKTALLQQTAINMVDSDPAAAFGLGAALPDAERRNFFDSLFAGWASNDTEAALTYAGLMPDQAERDAAILAIRSAAPVGIGAALKIQDGYPIVSDLVPGTPAQLSGQLHPGDRILALAQGDNSFVDARGMSLEKIVELIRGAPDTLLQLQVVSVDAPLDSRPRTIPIVRGQIKFKRSAF